MNEKITIYIEKDWINGKIDFLQFASNINSLVVQQEIKKRREAFVRQLLEEGFHIIYDKANIKENTICLIMNGTSLCDNNTSLQEYKKLFDEKIITSGGPNLHYPFTLNIEEYFTSPFFPAVFKNELLNGGDDKFLIENKEQLEKIKIFYQEYFDKEPYKSNFEAVIFQQLLKNPGKYATYIRILVGGIGEVLGASLKYATPSTQSKIGNGVFEKVFLNTNSKYFIDAKKMFNYYSGGGEIYFDQPRYSDEKAKILLEHGFSLQHLTLPNEILEVCKNIMLGCNQELGVLCGIDFMLNEEDQKWYYLENQAFPAIDEWAQAKNIRIPQIHNMKNYIKIAELEIKARYEALTSLINKQKEEIRLSHKKH